MSDSNKTGYSFMVKLVVLLIGFASMSDALLTPAFDSIFADFPDVNPNLLNLFLTGGMITSLIGTLLCGVLARYIGKKFLLIAAYILFIVSAGGGGLVGNIYYLVTMRLAVGFAYGISATAMMGLTVELFKSESERSMMIGLGSTVMSVIGAILALLGGYLTLKSWHFAYYPNLFAVPILFLIGIFIPSTPPEGKNISTETAPADKLPVKKIAPMVIAFTLVGALYFMCLYYVSFYLDETGLGDAGVAGIIASLGSVSGIVAGITFSFLYMKLKKASPPVYILLIAGGFLLMAFPVNIWLVGAAICLCSFAYISLCSYYYMHASIIVPPGVITLTMAILGAAMSVGGFLSPFFFDGYKTIFHAETVASTYLYIGITLALGGLISVVLAIRAKNDPDIPPEPAA
jgi:MFS family permease